MQLQHPDITSMRQSGEIEGTVNKEAFGNTPHSRKIRRYNFYVLTKIEKNAIIKPIFDK